MSIESLLGTVRETRYFILVVGSDRSKLSLKIDGKDTNHPLPFGDILVSILPKPSPLPTGVYAMENTENSRENDRETSDEKV